MADLFLNHTFKNMEYWDGISDHEYNIHPNKQYNPNKPISIIQNTKLKTDTPLNNISNLLSIIIDEYIMLYINAPQQNI